jgi:hypothetical protein
MVLNQSREGTIKWALCEAKSAGGEITDQDVANMRLLCERLRKIGMRASKPYRLIRFLLSL